MVNIFLLQQHGDIILFHDTLAPLKILSGGIMLGRVLALICFPILCFAGALTDDANGKFSTGSAASWVQPCSFSREPIPAKPSQEHVQYLLIDKQKNWEEKTSYHHFAIKALTQSGVDQISKVSIDFEPSFRKVVLHGIRVIRNGVESDRLQSSQHHILQQETGLDFGIYNGDLTVVYLLDDVRMGDIVEYSYSLIGHNPLFTSHYTDKIYLQYASEVEKFSYRLLSRPDHAFVIQPHHTSLEPKIRDLSPTLREWRWEMTETPTSTYEIDQPIWYSSSPRIEISQYRSWEEVGGKLAPLFVIPADFSTSCPEGMRILVRSWEAQATRPEDRALLALRFVQDEIRYLGLEEGISGFQPADPRVVFERRYGDCKDKACLLQAFLHMMHISSTPLLVNAYRGVLIPKEIPSPFAFNHAVLRIEIGNKFYYVDATMQLQGGSLETNCFPSYHNGLLLARSSPKLIPLPSEFIDQPIEIETSFLVTSKDSVTYTKSSIFQGSNADLIRRFVEIYGQKMMNEEHLNQLQEVYGGAKTVAPLKVLDDRKQNIVQITESYSLPTRAKGKGKTLKFFSSTVEKFLDSQINPERESPYALVYPLWVKEHVHVDNPFNTDDDVYDEKTYEHGSIVFTHAVKIEGRSADYYFELKHLQDHVPHDTLRDYWELCQEIEENSSQELTIASLKRFFAKRRLGL